jgi:fucose permease
MKFSMFREEDNKVSMRRVLAFFLVLAAVGLFAGGFFFAEHSWYVFLPGISCIAGSLFLLFFTSEDGYIQKTTADCSV